MPRIPNMNINTIENIIKDNPTDRYLWEDKETIDITIRDDKSFIEELLHFECPNCSIAVASVSDTHDFTADVNGIQIECSGCGLKMFVHKHVKF